MRADMMRWTWTAVTGPPAAALAVTALALAALIASPVAAAIPTSVDRLEGPSRFATAVAVSQDAFPGTANAVFVATGADFPDALAGTAAVAPGASGPILLTGRDALPDETVAEIERLQPLEAYVLGGEAAVADAVVEELAGLVPTAERIAGPDRYGTAAALVQRQFASGVDTVYLASGTGFPDALTAGAAAVPAGDAVLLTDGAALPDATAEALAALAPARVVAVGSPAVVADDVLAAAALAAGGAETTRSAGATRYDTAVALSAATVDTADRAFVATGGTFADALSGGLAAGLAGAPLLLTPADCLPPSVLAELDRLGVERLTVLGGADVVGEEVVRLEPCGEPGEPPPGGAGELTTDARVSTAAFGPIRFGMTPLEASEAAGLPFGTEDPLGSAPSCYYGFIEDPDFAEVSFLLADGTIGSVQVYGGGFRTDAGAGVGSTADEVRAAYGDVVVEEENPYNPEGLTLIVESPDGGGAIFFETDGSPEQLVTDFRAGRYPEVSYIEGCA